MLMLVFPLPPEPDPPPPDPDPPLQLILQVPLLQEVLRDRHCRPSHFTAPPHDTLQTPLLQEVDSPTRDHLKVLMLTQISTSVA